ncbi:MAG: tRNA pseudouridine(13) synthase TruD [Patescibacteria group bacterium]|jgi:tRNA pseudouridine13 synthase
MDTLANIYQKEQELLRQYSKPDLLAKRNFSSQDLLSQIGIDIDFGHLPQGYLNLYPQDFIVEEVSSEGRVLDILPTNLNCPPPPNDTVPTLYAELVKAGLSTIEAVTEIARALGVPLEKINYAGLKDKVAITAQQISVNDANYEKVSQLDLKGMFLKNFYWGTGNIYKGKLRGNQFTIIIRTPVTLGQGWLKSLLAQYKDGFYNFYYVQRFGSDRAFGHLVGRLILQRKFKEAVEMYMTDCGFQDVPVLNKIRSEAKKYFGDFKKLQEIFSQLPYTLKIENEMAQYLAENKDDYLGALKLHIEHLTLWVYSYGSYLFNLHLSYLIKENKAIPKRLPLLLNPKYAKVSTYLKQLQADGITDLENVVKEIFSKEMFRPQNTAPSKVPVKVIKAQIHQKSVVLNFRLPLGAYATTFLSHLFLLYRGMPIPDWVDQTKYDSKEILGLGSLKDAKNILGEEMFSQILEAVNN